MPKANRLAGAGVNSLFTTEDTEKKILLCVLRDLRGPFLWRPFLEEFIMSFRNLAMMLLILALVGVVHADDTVTLENAPPVVVRSYPQAGADNVSAAVTQISVTFSKNMIDGSWSWSTLGEENFPKMTGKPHYMADHRTCILPVHLVPGKTYAIWLNSDKFHGFQDSKNQPAVPYLLVFRTKP
jgi:hypothetical protein